MKVQSGGGHVAKLAHAPKAAQAYQAPKQDAAQKLASQGVQPTAQAGLAASGSVGTRLHAIG
jgi:hypothetical protein